MFLPYRAKNPPEHFPYVTIVLIAINVLIYAVTSDSLLSIREGVIQGFAISHATFGPVRLVAAMFLHGDPLHLLGNMLFLWIFGASVEGRMRPPLFIVLYFACGIAGAFLHDAMVGAAAPTQFSIGASGAIMGVAGAYIYMFPYSLICCAYGLRFNWGVTELQARWVVLVYVALDFLGAFLLRGADGVGHFAHLGGMGAGLLIPFLLRTRRDSEEASEAQAIQSDLGDHTALSVRDLEALLTRPTDDMNLVLTYCEKALIAHGGGRVAAVAEVVQKHLSALLQRGDPVRFAWVLTTLPADSCRIPAVTYFRVASKVEASGAFQTAWQLYARVYEMSPASPDGEAALARMARMAETVYKSPEQAKQIYAKLLQEFPYGQNALDARTAMSRL